MSRRLRIFVASTMSDLANERAAIVDRLASFNFEPVNAEGWAAGSTGTWERIREEIVSSDLFVLVLGERYGWIPPHGPRAGDDKSVTHLEYDEARACGLPILPFLRVLPYDAARDGEDARRRDAFRAEVASWHSGQYVGSFHLARDLAVSAGNAVIEHVTGIYRTTMERRAAAAGAAARRIAPASPPSHDAVPASLVRAVAERRAVLFAGAGVSLDAGLPAAAAWGEYLALRVRERHPHYTVEARAAEARRIASDLQYVAGRAALLEAVDTLLHPPQGVEPTEVHCRALHLFDRIVTTNLDALFERANGVERAGFATRLESAGLDEIPPRSLVQLYGSSEQPGSMTLTEEEANTPSEGRARLWSAVRRLLEERPVVVVGSSLQDPLVARTFSAAMPRLHGYYVDPYLQTAQELRVQRWNLQPVRVTAAALFRALEQALAAGR